MTAKPVMLVDTRQQEGKHALKHAQMEERYLLRRTKLYVGDYMLVGGTRAVDTKQSIAEFASNLQAQHARFRAECDRAREAGIELWVLVENSEGLRTLDDLAAWHEPEWMTRKRRHAKRPLDGETLARCAKSMHDAHGAHFVLCAPEVAGRAVMWILEDERREEGAR